jgi:hypothetical protein
MTDFLYIMLLILFFGLCALFAEFCERMYWVKENATRITRVILMVDHERG